VSPFFFQFSLQVHGVLFCSRGLSLLSVVGACTRCCVGCPIEPKHVVWNKTYGISIP
jgi:hypothetical protein